MFGLIVDKEGNVREDAYFIGSHLDGTPTCLVADAALFKDLFIEEKFPKLELIYSSLEELLGNGLVLSTGSLWKRQRKLLNPLFHYSKLKQMPSIMVSINDKALLLLLSC